MNLSKAQRRALMTHPAGWIASGFGAGLSPVAPGTIGSIVALIPWFAFREQPWTIYIGIVIAAFALGVWTASIITRRLMLEDPGVIVWDEWVGQWIALIGVPLAWQWVLAGFLLFRLFDVWKPWPVSWADRSIKGGLGVMLDDVVAGLYALCTLQAIYFCWDKAQPFPA